MIDEDMAHFARMGWDALRLTFWGDWESADSAGNLVANDHLDLLDYLIARARERGIYMLFSPIQLYGSNWPDALATSPPGFGRHFGKARMGTDPGAIAAQVNYLRQILTHVNPYTKVALKDEPSIIFIELVNEPWHHPEDLPGSVRYINALADAVRSTGCTKLIFYNISQDFRIGEAIRQSKAPHRLRVRRSRSARSHDVSRNDAHFSHCRHAVRRDVRLRHARHRLPQPRLADSQSESRLHTAESDEHRHRRGGDASPATRPIVRRISGEHALRRLSDLV
jgi:hypothetical protein